ncbi:uncharacterized protein BDR25DRAFT_277823 [Lindgomyces ingoldianus]|uniref:Uncharacterized protein n=1 Tax=Lindgomyces ingoldianus TaxID=673940 RepID=A0ACB6RBB8_9PLEO|nr:uncharacterized protein BDR25DRAFT_277823 [Lindgomyces ingoldianus]KAF2476578.1 hypothetical protein BDR25DRAFT_277823 [Lindgomyces ingoldianus]
MASSLAEPDTLPFDLLKQHRDDRGRSCISIDVGRDEYGMVVESLQHLTREVEYFILPDQAKLRLATKLYVIGHWNFTSDILEEADQAEAQASEPWTIIKKAKTPEEEEWKEGLELIFKVIRKLENLKELTWVFHDLIGSDWVSTLPFVPSTWEVLPTTLTKLVLDISQPVRLDGTDAHRESYLPQSGLKPLVNFDKLEELRIFGMRDSFQSIIWETVYRHDPDSDGMRILELSMANRPLIRQEGWLKAQEVVGLRVAKDDENPYKGLDGKGVLHYSYGTGEYLDDYCIRKARGSAGVDENKPVPLWRLKLDGFVVDHLPFETELSFLVFLSCGNQCIDAGLRAPKTLNSHNTWKCYIPNAITHCMIDWPEWTGIFDPQGRQLASDGTLIGLSEESKNESKYDKGDALALTTEHLRQMDLRTNEESPGEALRNAYGEAADLFTPSILHGGPPTPLDLTSIKSMRGSPLPSPDRDYFSCGSDDTERGKN